MTAQQGLRQRDAALAEVEAHRAPEVQAGLDVLGRWARSGEPFSPNDVRAELIEAGVSGPVRGRVFQLAVGDGIVGVPVTRTAGGRFAPAVEVMPGQVDIFEAIAEASS